MTDSEIREALILVKSALRSALEAERWSIIAMSAEASGRAEQVWQHASNAVADLEKLRRQLEAVQPL